MNLWIAVLCFGCCLVDVISLRHFRRYHPIYRGALRPVKMIPFKISAFKPVCDVKDDTSKYKSPILLLPRRAKKVSMETLDYSPEHWSCKPDFELSNNDYLAEYIVENKSNLTISGGPLCGKYQMKGFNFHWSDAENNGAEHSLKLKKFAGEVQLVYYNSKYDSYNASTTSPNGIAVLGFFLKAKAGKKNELFTKLTADVSKVEKSGTKVNVPDLCLDFFKETAKSRKYFYFKGSLTEKNGPPADWIIFKKPIEIENDQLDVFRKMKNSKNQPLSNIYPMQPLNGRTVYIAEK